MDHICGLLRGLQRHLPDEVNSTPDPALELEHLYAPQLTQINDSVYSLHCPEGKRPSVEIVLFHGLQLERSHGVYITSWVSRSQFNPELWVKWILEDEKLEDARILLMSYDAHVRKTNEEGRLDMHNTSENLISDLIDSAKVGQDGCPVILVGHCLGGVLMKELCVQAQDRHGRCSQDTINPGVQNFLSNVQGFVFYGSPHRGTELADISTFSKSPLFKDLKSLNKDAARRNEAFRKLRQKYGWRTFGIGETVPVNMRGFEVLVVKEGSAREDMDGYYSDTTANHFNVCRPETRKSSSFCKLKDFVSEIVEKDKSRQGPTMKTSDFGLESQVNEIRHKVLTSGLNRLGIVGMGGIGKTTLAKVVFNAILGYFDYTCFLMEVKKRTPDSLRNDIKGSLRVRGRLVDKAFKWSDLKKKRILLVLDDITDESHLQVITEDEFLSAQNCTLIVTARDTGLLRPEDFECHSVRELDYENSKKLFCQYAFKGAEPQYESLVKRFLQKCDGLPLAIEVAAKYLYKKSEVKWIESLDKLGSHSLSGNASDKLTSIVNMSYDGLAETEQEMFLDVAHCFHGQRLSTVKKIWQVCGCKGSESGWDNLLDKGLVTEVPDPKWWEYPEGDSRSFIQMHELLRDLGHSKPCPDPSKGSGSSQGMPPIHLHRWISSGCISWREDTQVLEIKGCKYWVFLPRSVGQLETVEVLKIANCDDLEAVPESLRMLSNLRDLSIQNCGKLSALPEFLGDLKSLRQVTIRGCGRLDRLPESLWRLRGLEYLVIDGCDGLGALPESFGLLSALKKLQISNCSLLQNLPGSIGDLQALQELTIQGCCNLTALPESLGKLRVLKTLTIQECDQLETLPTSLGDLPVLTHLEIMDCRNLHTLPASIHLLPALQRLLLRGCHHLDTLPKSLGQLQSLEDLTLERCFNLHSLPESLGQLRSLQHLTLEKCSNLVSLPESLWQLSRLRQLIIKCCQDLESLLWTFGLHEDLQRVTIKECTHLRFLPFGWPGALEQHAGCHVTIEGCPFIEDVPFTVHCQRASLEHLPMSIGNLQDLDHFTIQEGPKLEHLPEYIGRLGALKHLTIQRCQNVKELPKSIGDLRTLEYLTIEECPSLELLPENICQLGALKHLTIKQCQNLKELPKSMGARRALEYLTIQDCQNFEHLAENIRRLGLKHLTIRQCHLKELPKSIWKLHTLEYLTIQDCQNFESLTDIEELRALKHLTIQHCQNLKMVTKNSSGLRTLEYLRVQDCQTFHHFPFSVELLPLKHLTIQQLQNLKEIPESIVGLRALEYLTIQECLRLEHLPENIARLGDLKHLTIQQCPNLKELPESIGCLRGLEYLTIQDCQNFGHLAERIGGLVGLKHLTIQKCHLKQLPDSIRNLQTLEYLTIQDCQNFEHVTDIGELRALKHLTIQHCQNLKGVTKKGWGLQTLEYLTIQDCQNFGHLAENVRRLGGLKHLTIQRYHLKELPKSIGDLRTLEYLTVQECRNLEHLPEDIGRLGALKHLTIQQCHVKELPKSIGNLRTLEYLTIQDCQNFEHLTHIGELRALKHLTVQHCQNLKEVTKNGCGLGTLEYLTIQDCENLKYIGGLGGLKHLTIQQCENLVEADMWFLDLHALEYLTIQDCQNLDHLLKHIGKLGALKHLTIQDCQHLKRLPEMLPWRCTVTVVGSILDMHSIVSAFTHWNYDVKSLDMIRALKDYTMQECDVQEGLPEFIEESTTSRSRDIEESGDLTELTIDGRDSGHFVKLQGLTVLRWWRLKTLTIRWCSNLKELPESIGKLTALKHLTIEYNKDLWRLPKSIGNLKALEHLTIQGCPSLGGEPETLLYLRLERITIQGVNKSDYILESLHEGCLTLQRLPWCIRNLEALKQLTIDYITSFPWALVCN